MIKKIAILILFPFFLGCNENVVKNHVVIKVNCPNDANTMVSVVVANLLTYKEHILAEVQLDSLGTGILKFELDKTVFGNLRVANEYYKIFLQPDDRLDFNISTGDISGVFFEGKGAIANNYLHQVKLIWDDFYRQNDGVYELTPDVFSWTLDELAAASRLR